jgi:Cof subfamily protein (haloacid dehalogenase superfamily)
LQFILQQVPGVAAVVALNGALVFDIASETVLLEISLPSTEITALLRWCIHHNCQVILCCLESIHVTRLDPVVENYVKRTQVPVNVRVDLHEAIPSTVYKALVYHRHPEPTDELALADILRRARVVPNCTLYKSDHGYVEVVSAGVSKDRGLTVALEASGLQNLPLMAVGDGENDVGMLQLADYGYAVANACAEARAAADIVVGDCNSNGVAEAITHFMKNLSKQLRVRG